jgi:hypothetical protein
LGGDLFLWSQIDADQCVPSSKPPMTAAPPPRADAVTAGALLVGTMVACAGAGFALGSLVGLAVPAGLLGLFAGVVVGFSLVYARFKRI